MYIELKNAFDTINHDIYIAKLECIGFRVKTLDLLKSYCTDRYQYVEINGKKTECESITCRVPQGSVLGPLLFLMYINDLTLSCTEVESVLRYYNFPCWQTEQWSFMENLKLWCGNWFEKNCLTINESKFQYMKFGRNKICRVGSFWKKSKIYWLLQIFRYFDWQKFNFQVSYSENF